MTSLEQVPILPIAFRTLKLAKKIQLVLLILLAPLRSHRFTLENFHLEDWFVALQRIYTRYAQRVVIQNK